jgi:hypothetical protein|tara:strand:+ start:72 stop:179 length:108 start_codon:yes stop_codon:yes gene_type:complete
VTPIIQNWNQIVLELKEWQEFGRSVVKEEKEVLTA